MTFFHDTWSSVRIMHDVQKKRVSAELTRYIIRAGTALIAVGAVLIGYFGVVQEPTHSLDDLLALYSRPTFVVFASLFTLLFIGVLAIAHLAEWQLHVRLFRSDSGPGNHRSPGKKKRKPVQRRWSAPSLAPVAEVSESSSGIATPVLAIADEAARRGIPVERVLMHRNGLMSSLPRAGRGPMRDYGSTRARGTSSPSHAPMISDLEDLERKSTSAAAIAAAQHDPAVRRTCLGLAVAYGGASGTLSGACLLLAKSGVELLVLTIAGDNQFDRWQSWFLVVVMLLAALLQLWYLNKSLRLASPPLVCPLAFCFYNTSSIALGLVYFNQLGALSLTSIIFVVVGIAVLLAGVWMVSLHGHGSEIKAEEQEPLLSDVSETISSPTSSPLSSNVALQSPLVPSTDTGGVLANAGGVAGPHLPPPPSSIVVTEVGSTTNGAASPEAQSPEQTVKWRQKRRSRSGSESGNTFMGGLGLHMPGLPQHPRQQEEDMGEDDATDGVDQDQAGPSSPSNGDHALNHASPSKLQARNGSASRGMMASALLSPTSRKRRGLYEALLERGLSIGISPSSPGFHVGSSFELEPDMDGEGREARRIWRSRFAVRRTLSETDTGLATARRQRAQDIESGSVHQDERDEGSSSSAWSRVIPTLDIHALNDRLRKIKLDAGGWIGTLRS